MVGRIRRQGERLEMPGLRIEEVVERVQNQEQFPGIGGLLPLIFSSLGTLFDYIPKDFLPVLVDPGAVEKRAVEMAEIVTKNYVSAAEEGHLCVEPESLYLNWSEAESVLKGQDHLALKLVPVADGVIHECDFAVEKNHLVTQKLKARREPEALLRPLVDWIEEVQKNGLAPFLVCRSTKQAKRLDALLSPYGIALGTRNDFPSREDFRLAPTICIGHLSSGFTWAQEGLAVITEDEVFGPQHHLPKVLNKQVRYAMAFL